MWRGGLCALESPRQMRQQGDRRGSRVRSLAQRGCEGLAQTGDVGQERGQGQVRSANIVRSRLADFVHGC